jgi:hypothetical protein
MDLMVSVRLSLSIYAFYDMQEGGLWVYSFSPKGRPAPTKGHDGLRQTLSLSIYRLLRYEGEGVVG